RPGSSRGTSFQAARVNGLLSEPLPDFGRNGIDGCCYDSRQECHKQIFPGCPESENRQAQRNQSITDNVDRTSRSLLQLGDSLCFLLLRAGLGSQTAQNQEKNQWSVSGPTQGCVHHNPHDEGQQCSFPR